MDPVQPITPTHAGRGGTRAFIALFFLLLFAPLLLHLATLGQSAVVFGGREPHPRPALPHGIRDVLQLPAALDLWLQDRHGLRRELVTLNGALRWHVLGDPASDRIVPGRRGRLFLANHDDAAANSLILDTCGAGTGAAKLDTADQAIRTIDARLRQTGLRPAFLIIPTAARLYPEDLPPPFDAQCAGRMPPVDALAARMTTPAPVLHYPLPAMAAMKPERDVIPRRNFHWSGDVPRQVIAHFSEQVLGLRQAVAPAGTDTRIRTDFASINPGMYTTFPARVLDGAAMGWRLCIQQQCGAVDGVPASAVRPLQRYLREGPGARLLLIGDSYSEWSAEMFTPHAAEIWHIRTNLLGLLAPADRTALMAAALRRFQGQHVVLMFHDFGALTTIPALPGLLWPEVNAGR